MTDQLSRAGLTAGTWTLDPSHSAVGFTARHLMSKVRGTFGEFTGEFITTEDPTESAVSVVIKRLVDHHRTTSSATGTCAPPTSSTRRSAANSASSAPAIRPSGDGYVITGDLTINGITKSVDLDAEFLGVATDAYGRTVLGAEATTTINRHDFNVDWNMPLDGGRLLIGPKIDINLSVEAVRA